MLPDYDDIRSRIAERPAWFDENGTPRYGPFDPEMLGIYDYAAVLVKISCQRCHKFFLVGEGSSDMDRMQSAMRSKLDQDEMVEYLKPETWLKAMQDFHYGDPPRHGCVGDTMNCVDHAIVQAWIKNKDWSSDERWLRQPEFEGDMELPDWAK